MATIAHVLHAQQLRELADGKSYERGERYHRDGRVSALAREGKTIKATVTGSEPYDVTLWVTGDRIAYACSCPVGDEGLFCKHCVAVALALIAQRPAAPAAAEARPTSESSAMTVFAPSPLPETSHRTVFLAGSIDMGAAPPWQGEIAAALADLDELVIFNPRRPDWDKSWKQSVDDARFREQVEWELAALERADVIAMYFAPTTQAPITLLELGLHAAGGKLVVCCPDGYWRKGNVDVVCRRFAVHQTHDLATLATAVRARLNALPPR